MMDCIEQDGFAIARNVLPANTRAELIAVLGPVEGAGRRGLLRESVVARTAGSESILDLVRPHLPAEPLPVRAIYFDKSPDTNWLVAWHQDVTLAVRAKADVPEFGPWSIKDGVPHVQPPAALLEKMLTVRLHLDDADELNGALRIIPGSHRDGKFSATNIAEIRKRSSEVVCSVLAGDALLMRPLLLHASGRSESPRHRRVLHIEYAGFSLPDGLEWHERNQVST